MTMTLVKLRYNSKLVPDPGLVLQTPLCNEEKVSERDYVIKNLRSYVVLMYFLIPFRKHTYLVVHI